MRIQPSHAGHGDVGEVGGEPSVAHHTLVDHLANCALSALGTRHLVHLGGALKEVVENQVQVVGVHAFQAPLHLPHGTVIVPLVHLGLKENPIPVGLHGQTDAFLRETVRTIVRARLHEGDAPVDGRPKELRSALVVGCGPVEPTPRS